MVMIIHNKMVSYLEYVEQQSKEKLSGLLSCHIKFCNFFAANDESYFPDFTALIHSTKCSFVINGEVA